MSDFVMTRGSVQSVNYKHTVSTVVVRGTAWDVPEAEADKALAAKRAGRDIEIFSECGVRTVRLVPVVVVKARGKVQNVRTYTDEAWLGQQSRAHFVSNISVAARAYADDAEVEIVSIDGGPDTVRRVS